MKEKIFETLKECKGKEFSIKEIKQYSPIEEKKNELLFFIKPEVFEDGVNFEKILEITLEKFCEFGVEIESAALVSGIYLKKYNIMAEHYGVINKVARFGKKELTSQALENFEKIFGVSPEKAEIFGAFEFLEKYKEFNEFALDVLWENLENKKLASGIYCEKVKIGNKTVFVLNGFHPYQLLHYTRENAMILVMAVASDSKWKVLRNEMLGATNPANAKEGSLRRIFLEKKEELGLKEVSQGYNCVHLSAGPVEALVEILRFCSNYETGKRLKPEDTAIGKKFLAVFSEETIQKFIENPKVEYEGKTQGVFDITEEMDVDEAIEVLKKIF